MVVNAVMFWLFGAGFLFAPGSLSTPLDIELGSATAFADFRAMYGGLPLACALLFTLSLSRPSRRCRASA